MINLIKNIQIKYKSGKLFAFSFVMAQKIFFQTSPGWKMTTIFSILHRNTVYCDHAQEIDTKFLLQHKPAVYAVLFSMINM